MDKKSIFRQESLDRVASPEKLNDYIKVSNPSIWLVMLALFALVVGVCVWGATGTLPKTMTVKGVITDERTVTCYIGTSNISSDIIGCKSKIVPPQEIQTDISGTVTEISQNPYSAEEIASLLGSDWMINNLVQDNYVYIVTIKLDEDSSIPDNTLADVTLITSEVKPIDFILN